MKCDPGVSLAPIYVSSGVLLLEERWRKTAWPLLKGALTYNLIRWSGCARSRAATSLKPGSPSLWPGGKMVINWSPPLKTVLTANVLLQLFHNSSEHQLSSVWWFMVNVLQCWGATVLLWRVTYIWGRTSQHPLIMSEHGLCNVFLTFFIILMPVVAYGRGVVLFSFQKRGHAS